MNYKLLIILIFISTFLNSNGLFSAGETDESRVLEIARQTIVDARYAALITIDENGQPRARTVDPFPPSKHFVIWIATRPVTRKVAQIKAHKEVTLYYWHVQSSSYVTIMGTAELVDDRETKIRLRREVDSERFYPEFPDDYVLIKVTPTWLEAIVPGFRGDPKTWRPVVIDLRS